MLAKMKQFKRMMDTGVVAVIRAGSPEQAMDIAEAVRKGGVDIIEITLTVPGAMEAIAGLAKRYRQGEILIGAGTVLDPETARVSILAGANFIVSPSFNPEVVKLCNRYQKLSMAGCATVTEMVTALEAGADLIKLFPGNAFGPGMIKAFKGPLPQAEFIPTGGVSLENVQEWIGAGCIAVGVGGELTRGADQGDYQAVAKTAEKFVEKVREARR